MRLKLALLFLTLFIVISAFTTSASVLTVNISTTPDACNGSMGQAMANASGGVQPYSYLWSNGANTVNITNLTAGTYTVTVTDNSGATATATGNVTNSNLLLQPMVSTNPAIGYNAGGGAETIMMNGTPPFNIFWCDNVQNTFFGYTDTRGGMTAHLTGTACNFSGHQTEYSFTVTDANGCTGSGSAVICAAGIELPTPTAYGACNGSANGRIMDTLITGTWCGQYGTLVLVHQNLGGGNIVFVDSIEVLSNGYLSIPGLLPGNYMLDFFLAENTWPVQYQPGSIYTVNVSVPDLGVYCGSIQGKVYVDMNNNCINDAGDFNQQYSMIEIQPGDIHMFSDDNGDYSLDLNYGNYTIAHTPSMNAPLGLKCPSAQPYAFVLDSLNQTQNINFADTSNGVDLRSFVHFATALRPGFAGVLDVTLHNPSATISTNDSVEVFFDTLLQVTGYSLTPAETGNGYVKWPIGTLNMLSRIGFSVYFTVPPDPLLIGTSVTAVSNVLQSTADLNPANDVDSVSSVITGAYDPNRISVSPSGYTNSNLIPKSYPYLDYVIEFQNTGTNTAFNVVLIDTLDTGLDVNSYVTINSSHAYSVEVYNSNILKIQFDNILLPDSNTNEPLSHGYFSYRISLKDNVMEGQVISATAGIYFDFNPPIITNTASLTLYDCDNISGLIPSTMLICEGDDLLMIANSIVPADVNWYYDNNFMVTSDTLQIPNLQTGIHDIILESVTPYCTQNQLHQANVNPLPAVTISVDADTLEAITSGFIYQWYLNGNIINGATSQQYIAQQSGNYSVEVTDFQGCSNMSSQVYVSLTGIAESNENQFLLSPNPGSDYVKIESSEINYNLKVTDITGKIILEEFINSSSRLINSSEWSAGIYVFTVYGNNGIRQLKWMK